MCSVGGHLGSLGFTVAVQFEDTNNVKAIGETLDNLVIG